MIPEVLRKMLPQQIVLVADKLNTKDLYEIRLRSERATSVNVKGQFYYLCNHGLTKNPKDGITVSAKDVKDVLIKATEYSLYAVNNQICEGYLTIGGGIRIGIAGETVIADAAIKTIKNFNALNIRLPHEVLGCADKVIKYINSGSIKSAIFISPPGAGKTTILRDTARILSSLPDKIYNVLVVDERNEIAAMNDGKMLLNIGVNSDVINGAPKSYAFTRAVRALRPDIIVTDELFDSEDVAAASYAINSGVAVIASVHGSNHTDLFDKKSFDDTIKNKLFKLYINLSDRYGPGTLESIYDENFKQIFSP